MPTEGAYTALYERNADMVFAIALSYLRSREDAEDVVADVFAQIFEERTEFQNLQHERAWLITAVKNRCRNHLRHWSRKQRTDEEIPEQVRSDEAKVRLHTVMDIIAQMPERYRLPLVLHTIQGYSVSETAQILNTKESTITTRISRAREILNKKMGGELS